ncbi:UNVERIFIED_CONTAM: Receptor-like protein kinase FERONIA [Sesamum calycinum]|uniref:Receptor-like protein kinase FERONIA n=1 Tax=Sesamum calycinum TaxID=2727403 RepID=A0AAW2NXR4_9LAMI
MRNANKLWLFSALGCLSFLFLLDVISAADYAPTDKIFLNCGGPPDSTDSDGRKWTSDIGLNSPIVFQASGRKFVRLYFYPASYNGLNASNAIFSVTSGAYTLLRNFSAALTTEALNYDYIMKEFSVNVPSEVLNVTFIPSQNASNSYAFVNGIEVVSHPDIYSTDGTEIVVGLFRSWGDDSNYIFSAANGVTEVPDPNVTVGFPPGSPSYVAPLDVYGTLRSMGPNASVNQNFNLTWVFNIDSGFSYLVRLHFCEITDVIYKVNQRVFTIFLNNQTAEQAADVIAWAGSNGVPVHRDYVVVVPNGPPQQLLWLDLHPYTASKPQYYDAILNGVEIFKINDTTGNLAGPNPDPLPEPPADSSSQSSSASGNNHKAAIGGGVGGGIAAVSSCWFVGLYCFPTPEAEKGFYHQRWVAPLSLYGNSHSSGSAKTNTTGSCASSLPSNLCRHFSIAEIKAATNNFDEALLLGLEALAKFTVERLTAARKLQSNVGTHSLNKGCMNSKLRLKCSQNFATVT